MRGVRRGALAMTAPVVAQEAPPFAALDLAGPAVLSDPHDLAIGPDGRLYVADKLAGRIAVLDPETLEIVDDIGAGTLPQARDVSFAPDGRAVVAVTGSGRDDALRGRGQLTPGAQPPGLPAAGAM